MGRNISKDPDKTTVTFDGDNWRFVRNVMEARGTNLKDTINYIIKDYKELSSLRYIGQIQKSFEQDLIWIDCSDEDDEYYDAWRK